MALLMTPTLWDAIDWCNNCPPNWKKSANENLLNMLNRKWAPTAAIERGIAYEKKLYNPDVSELIGEIAPNIDDKFREAHAIIHAEGADFQAKTKKIILDNKGNEYLLYGKMDVYFYGKRIIDIKTTGSYRGKSSYLKKWQHKIYTFCTGVKDFKYIVYEFNDAGMLADIHTIDYFANDLEANANEIQDNLEKVLDYLRNDKKLKSAYLKTFNLYN